MVERKDYDYNFKQSQFFQLTAPNLLGNKRGVFEGISNAEVNRIRKKLHTIKVPSGEKGT